MDKEREKKGKKERGGKSECITLFRIGGKSGQKE